MATRSSKPATEAGSVSFWLPGPPPPAPRPRFRTITARGGKTFTSTYYDAKYKAYLDKAPKAIKALVDVQPFDGPVALEAHFYVEKPKSTKRDTPRYDIDNYLKAIMDAITYAGLWSDDDQVASVTAWKLWADERGTGTYARITRV